ncbi:putative organic hydroperoxide resistance protein [Cladochytrium replicatum]|nr:putative organic hydroperoxide resistance protein [Cladochytrium replicatum]
MSVLINSSLRAARSIRAPAALLHSQVRAFHPLYTANATASGAGRDGKVTTTEGFSAVMHPPKTLGGPGNEDGSVNPELLFATGYSACFLSAVQAAAKKKKVAIPDSTSVNTLVTIGREGDRFTFEIEQHLKIPGFEKDAANALVEAAHKLCPYSNAIHGNIAVKLSVETD